MSKRRYTARFLKPLDKVNVYWRGQPVMGVLHVSRTYNTVGRTPEEVADTVLQDVEHEADSIVEDFLINKC